jgi:hypothetical protein
MVLEERTSWTGAVQQQGMGAGRNSHLAVKPSCGPSHQEAIKTTQTHTKRTATDPAAQQELPQHKPRELAAGRSLHKERPSMQWQAQEAPCINTPRGVIAHHMQEDPLRVSGDTPHKHKVVRWRTKALAA